MLSRRENEVMSAVYCLCDGTDGCLISPTDIMNLLPFNKKYTAERVESALTELKQDGYLDVIPSVRKGQKMYAISLKASGLAFKRNEKKRKQEVLYRLGMALFGAVATFIFGAILKGIFK